jgi:hypothetical protein
LPAIKPVVRGTILRGQRPLLQGPGVPPCRSGLCPRTARGAGKSFAAEGRSYKGLVYLPVGAGSAREPPGGAGKSFAAEGRSYKGLVYLPVGAGFAREPSGGGGKHFAAEGRSYKGLVYLHAARLSL